MCEGDALDWWGDVWSCERMCEGMLRVAKGRFPSRSPLATALQTGRGDLPLANRHGRTRSLRCADMVRTIPSLYYFDNRKKYGIGFTQTGYVRCADIIMGRVICEWFIWYSLIPYIYAEKEICHWANLFFVHICYIGLKDKRLRAINFFNWKFTAWRAQQGGVWGGLSGFATLR